MEVIGERGKRHFVYANLLICSLRRIYRNWRLLGVEYFERKKLEGMQQSVQPNSQNVSIAGTQLL